MSADFSNVAITVMLRILRCAQVVSADFVILQHRICNSSVQKCNSSAQNLEGSGFTVHNLFLLCATCSYPFTNYSYLKTTWYYVAIRNGMIPIPLTDDLYYQMEKDWNITKEHVYVVKWNRIWNLFGFVWKVLMPLKNPCLYSKVFIK
jgi:hypothetical protein